MQFKTYTFSREEGQEFISTLKKRVDQYFKDHNLSKRANSAMYFKTIFMFLLYLVPYALVVSGVVANPFLYFTLWIFMAVGMAGIGFNVMHDANHGSFARNKSVNRILSWSMNIIGGNNRIWKIQHNMLHHTFTNIEGHDEDIDTPGILRFSPHTEKKPIHKFQFLYAWFFYGISTLSWITIKEYKQLIKYRKMGIIEGGKEFVSNFLHLTGWKIFYFVYALVLPLIFAPVATWLVVVSFICMHILTGLIISTVFQLAHVMPSTDYPLPDETGSMQNSWAVHQLNTTANFAPKSRILSWFVGGLNYQIEHHLFSNISHIHYRKLSKIVQETAKQYKLPYHCEPNFFSAVRSHVRMLYMLGRLEPAKVKTRS
jgi:linoleoyl-CoA desaturase